MKLSTADAIALVRYDTRSRIARNQTSVSGSNTPWVEREKRETLQLLTALMRRFLLAMAVDLWSALTCQRFRKRRQDAALHKEPKAPPARRALMFITRDVGKVTRR